MFKLFNLFVGDIGVDLGTSRTTIYLKNKGVLINEPTIVAINTRTDQIIALGESALKMEGRAPGHIKVIRPVVNGVVVNFEVAEKMVKNLLNRISGGAFYSARPIIITAVPLDVTEVEKKSLEDIMLQVGAKKVFLVERPVAAAIGCNLPIQDPIASLVVEIGAGLTEIAVISLSGIVAWRSLKIGGDSLDSAIINFIRDRHSLLIGKKTAEEIKIKIGSVFIDKPLEMKVKGRDLSTGLPREIKVNNEEFKEIILPQIKNIIENIREVIEETPPELVSDIYERGIVLSGGVSLLQGLVKLIGEEIKAPVHLSNDASDASGSVIHGLGMILEDFNNLKDVIIPSASD